MRKHFAAANVITPERVFSAHEVDVDDDAGQILVGDRAGAIVASLQGMEWKADGWKRWLARGTTADGVQVWRITQACTCRSASMSDTEEYEVPVWDWPA